VELSRSNIDVMQKTIFVDLTGEPELEGVGDILEYIAPRMFCLHRHTGFRTPFRSWIALQQHRLSKKFEFQELGDDCYQISVAGDCQEGTADSADQTAGSCLDYGFTDPD